MLSKSNLNFIKQMLLSIKQNHTPHQRYQSEMHPMKVKEKKCRAKQWERESGK